MKKFSLFLLAFLMLALNVQATTWVQVGDYEYIDKDSVEYYINDRGEMQFNKKTYWMKTINHDGLYKEAEKISKKKISYSKDQWIADITKKSIAVKSGISYDKEGNVVSSYSFQDYELNWSPIVPESKGELWFELIRKPRYLKKLYKMQLAEQNQ